MTRRRRRRREKKRRHAPRETLDRGGHRLQLATGAGVTIGATLMMGGVADAVPCILTPVNSLADPSDAGHETLRDAINCANLNPGSTVTFASGLSGTITLGSTLPQISAQMTIQGPGAGQLAISGNNAVRVFSVYPSPANAVTISGVTITGGRVAGEGAGIYSRNADLTVSGAVISGNQATSVNPGGGIAVRTGHSLTVTNSTISGNLAGRGGGVYTASGAGVPSTIRSSTISGNGSGFVGGGAYFDYTAPATVENSTIYGNTANTANGAGGGLYHFGQKGGPGLIVTGSTITHNSATRGGGVASFGDPTYTQPTLRNTIVAGNSAAAGPDVSANGGSMSAGFSLVQASDPATTINQTVPGSDIFGQNPLLGPLASNGGPTQTQKPFATSPAVDRGSAFGLGTDQRGLPRPLDIAAVPNAGVAGADGSDIGAFELQLAEIPPNAFTVRVRGKKLLIGVSAPGTVDVTDAAAPLSAGAAKKKRKLGLKPSSASGAPPTITVALRLTKLAKQKLRLTGKVTVHARITFTPTGGLPKTVTQKLRIRTKK